MFDPKYIAAIPFSNAVCLFPTLRFVVIGRYWSFSFPPRKGKEWR